MRSLVVCFPYQASHAGEQHIRNAEDRVVPLPDGSDSTPKELEELIKAHSADRTNIIRCFERSPVGSKALNTLLTGFLDIEDGVLPLKNAAIWMAFARLLDVAVVTVILPGSAHVPALKIVATYLPK